MPPEVAAEILRQGEARLQAQTALGVAADQRATALTGVFGAGAIALVAAGLTVLAGNNVHMPLVAASSVAAGIMFVACIMAAMATSPSDFHIPGARASVMMTVADQPIAIILLGQAHRYEERINFNTRALERAARLVTWAIRVGVSAPALGVISYFAATRLL